MNGMAWVESKCLSVRPARSRFTQSVTQDDTPEGRLSGFRRRWKKKKITMTKIRLITRKRLPTCFAALLSIACVFGCLAESFAQSDWKKAWDKTLEAAKKEGQVTVYISGYEAVLPHFEKEYPEIKLNAVTGRGNQLGQRLLAERRAEKFIADVVSAGANPNYQQFHVAKALDPIKAALILPEVTDQSGT
jgi:hypothetical protein